jgi:TRAP-type C4-dicarboxylate transport system permease small subunit
MENSQSISRKSPFSSALHGFSKISYLLSVWFERIAMVAIVGIIVATIVDVLGDKLFDKPLSAGTEIVYFLQVIAIAGALAFTKIDGKHIRLEFVDSFPKKLKNGFNLLSAVLGLGLFVILSWKSYEYAQALKTANEVTAASRIPIFPFVIWVGICCIPLCLVLLKDIVDSAIGVFKK